MSLAILDAFAALTLQGHLFSEDIASAYWKCNDWILVVNGQSRAVQCWSLVVQCQTFVVQQ